MMVPVVTRGFDYRQRYKPKRYAGKHPSTMAGFSVLEGSCNETRCKQHG
jgi:hypothetical protein